MILELSNIGKSFKQGENQIKVLNDLSFSLEVGNRVSIIGRSGSGKSTLLSIICGIIKPDHGQVNFNGKILNNLTQDELSQIRGSEISIIFQQFHLLPHLNALENISLALEIKGELDCDEKAKKFLDDVGLNARANHFPHQLSGGEQQRVAIARSLATNPKLLLADEPSGSLDEETGNIIMDLLFNLTEKNNTTLMLVTHSHKLAQSCQNIYQLKNGVLEQSK